AQAGDRFGTVAIGGDIAIVGARLEDGERATRSPTPARPTCLER
ncbi:MAG: hypothetical protein IIB21_07465, partial [Chloroflexi bacterium]|nr:hypothetical protein [Chloroflexota bacterium]